MTHVHLAFDNGPAAARRPVRRRFGSYLLDAGRINERDLHHALHQQRHVDAPLGEVLVAEGLITRAQALGALARQHDLLLVDLDGQPPALAMRNDLPAAICLQFQVVPWAWRDGQLMIATASPDRFAALRLAMGPMGKRMQPVLAAPKQIRTQISRLYGLELAQKAATRVPAAESCRSWEITGTLRRNWALGILALFALALIAAPLQTLALLMVLTTLCLLATTVFKASALTAEVIHRLTRPKHPAPQPLTPFRLPKVSVLVPLLREKEIAHALLERLSRLTYPKSLLEVVLVLERSDTVTRETLARTTLPDWISVIEVPQAGRLTTKPRALNYALNFCEGSIIGVWDAEDAPEGDQIEKAVQRFHSCPENVACLQGRLDYYNPKANWLSRCFTIEYAAWWRVLLPGVARLGLVLPLGGTTLFFRRPALEKLCGWDAHNVTEDADLGLRLARHGYRTELIDTVTHEEANCRLWPWVRQRSRWLKGFLITWCVHMRDPGQLLRDLGLKRFLGVQVMLLGTFVQFAAAPLLWSYWLLLAGLPHPVPLVLGHGVMWAMITLFILAETLNLITAAIAVSAPAHRHLMGWVITLPLYFVLGTLAAAKALPEFVLSPFFWDKTEHGVTAMPPAPVQSAEVSPLPRGGAPPA